MRKKKQENIPPVETDFFAEALKALDAPSSPVEQPMQEKQAETTAVKPQKLKFLRKWWPAILSILLCAVLLISFWPKPERTPRRGENWVYGSVMSHGEDFMVLQDPQGENWYVDIAGLEVPDWLSGTHLLLESRWVFYDGKPQDYSFHGCTKKVTATLVLNHNASLVEGLEEYGPVYDVIAADLDRDGKTESWLLCEGSTSGVSSLRVVGLDERGNCEYDVTVLTPNHSPYLFQYKGEKLQIIGPYSTFDVLVTGGLLRLYNRGEMLKVLWEQSPQTPSADIGTAPAIKFILIDNGSADSSRAESDWISLPAEDIKALKDSLDALEWETNPALSSGGLRFALSLDGQVHEYNLMPDGMLQGNGQSATVTKDIWNSLLVLMGRDANNESNYTAYPSKNAEIELTFDRVIGTVDIFDKASGRMMMNIAYGSVGNYLYVCNVGRDVKNAIVLVLQIHDDGTLEFCSSLSRFEVFDIPDQLLFLPKSMSTTAQPRQVDFRLTPQPLHSGEQVSTGYYGWVLSDQEREAFHKILSGLEWVENKDYDPIGTMRVQFEDGTSKEYFLLDGGRLAIGNKQALLGVDSRAFIVDLMIQASSIREYEDAVYTPGEGSWLTLTKANVFILNYGNLAYVGRYAQIGRVLYLSDQKGAVFLLVEHPDGTLEYVDHGFGYLPNGLQFVLAAEPT